MECYSTAAVIIISIVIMIIVAATNGPRDPDDPGYGY